MLAIARSRSFVLGTNPCDAWWFRNIAPPPSVRDAEEQRKGSIDGQQVGVFQVPEDVSATGACSPRRSGRPSRRNGCEGRSSRRVRSARGKIGMSSEALVSSAMVTVEVRLAKRSDWMTRAGRRLAVLALGRDGDQVAPDHSRGPAPRASRASRVFGDVRRGRFLQLAEFRIGAVCGVGDRGLTRALLGKAWRAGVGDPDLDWSQPLRSERGSTLRDALCAGGCGRHGLSPGGSPCYL